MILLLLIVGAVKVGAPDLIAAAGAIAGALAMYFVAARRLSGRINTSEASSLWLEAGRLRQEYKDEIAELRQQVVACEERLAVTEERNRTLHRENTAQETEIMALRGALADCQAKVERLEAR